MSCFYSVLHTSYCINCCYCFTLCSYLLRLFFFLLFFTGSNNEKKVSVMQPDVSKTYRKRSIVVPQAYSHSFVGSRTLSSSSLPLPLSSDRHDHNDAISALSRGVCVPLPSSVSVQSTTEESLVIVTDVAPFRSVVVSVCDDICTRGGRTNAHEWLASKTSCRGLEQLEVVVMPHSRRRHHLHHSYDPLMHFGKERHHHRWSRVTSADLIDEAKYRSVCQCV